MDNMSFFCFIPPFISATCALIIILVTQSTNYIFPYFRRKSSSFLIALNRNLCLLLFSILICIFFIMTIYFFQPNIILWVIEVIISVALLPICIATDNIDIALKLAIKNEEKEENISKISKLISYLEQNDKLILNIKTDYTPSDLFSEMSYLFLDDMQKLWFMELVDKEQKKVNLTLFDTSTNIFVTKNLTLTEESYANLTRAFQYTLE